MKKGLVAVLAILVSVTGIAAAGEYLAGDFHQHTLYTDGSWVFAEVMKANNDFDLDWWANSEHGGARNRDGQGVKWLDTDKYPVNPILGDNPAAGYMYRWQCLRDFVYPEILTARMDYPTKTVISGVEWNVPSHEHCSVAVYGYDNTANLISEFEYRFDKSDKDTSRNGEASLLAGYPALFKTNSSKADSIAACAFMQQLVEQGLGDAWVVPAHVERATAYKIEDFRNWNNAGPDVAFGFEGAPGHQCSGGRGGFGTSAYGGTFGGSGNFCAVVGGLWDALLGEGRNYWNYASSDFHNHWTKGSSDFFPGEYQKNYTYVDTDADDQIQAVFDGVRSGNSFHVMGDLIDDLEFTAHGQGKEKAMMGQTLTVEKGKMVTIKIKVHDPAGANNCPFDMMNPSLEQVGIMQPLNMPVLDHIDLIAGDVTGYVAPEDAEYTNPTNPSAAVVATFERNGGDDKNGTMTYVYQFKAEKDCFFRLRGTNLPANIPFETDEMGNPLADTEADSMIYDDIDKSYLEGVLFEGIEITSTGALQSVAEAYADLWFYSNPIFVKVVE